MTPETIHIIHLKFQGLLVAIASIVLSIKREFVASFLSSKIMLYATGSNLAIFEDVLHFAILILTIASLLFSIRLSIVNHRKIKDGEK